MHSKVWFRLQANMHADEHAYIAPERCIAWQSKRIVAFIILEPVHLKAKYVTFLPERSQALWPTKLRDYPSSTWYGTIDIVTRCDIACHIAFVASIPCDIAFVSSITCMCACDKNLERYDCLTVWKQSGNFSRTKIRPDVSLLYVILHTDFLLCCFFFRFCKKNDMRRGLIIIYQPDVSSWGCWGEGGVSPLVWYLTIHPSF
jgi:hypothetical protein